MTSNANQFEHSAEAVVERIADLLGARVSVVNDHGMVIASNQLSAVGLAFDKASAGPGGDYVRVPLRLNGYSGEVVVAEPANGEVISQRLARVLVELVVNQTIVVARLPNQHELKNKFIHELLRGPTADETYVLREGEILGMDLTRPRAVILIDAADYILGPDGPERSELSDVRTRRRAQMVIGSVVSFFQLPSDTICAYIGDGEVAVLKASSSQDLIPWSSQQDMPVQSSPSWANLAALKRAATSLLTRLHTDTQAPISIGIGRYHPGIRGLAHSYQDARAALSLGRPVLGRNQVHCLDGLGIAGFVGISDEETKVELARHLLSPLDQEPELLHTLQTFFEANCSASATAKELAIHRNTLRYRLDKITSLIGLDPRCFDDAIQIRLALFVRSLPTAPS